MLLGSQHLYLDLLLIGYEGNVWPDEIIQHVLLLQVAVTVVQRLVSILEPCLLRPLPLLLQTDVWHVVVVQVTTTYSHVTV